MISADVMPSSEYITFDPAQLDTNSNYNVSVLAINIAGSAVSYTRISECCDYWVCVYVNIIGVGTRWRLVVHNNAGLHMPTRTTYNHGVL